MACVSSLYICTQGGSNSSRAFMHTLELKSQKEWRAYRRGDMPEKGIKPPDIPGNPHRAYKDKGWISWSDWLEKTKPSLIN